MLRPPPTPVTTVDRCRCSHPLPLTTVTIIAARRRQPPSAVAVNCRRRQPQPSTVAAVDRPRCCRLPSSTAAAFTNLPCLPLGEQILLTWLQEPVRSWDFCGSLSSPGASHLPPILAAAVDVLCGTVRFNWRNFMRERQYRSPYCPFIDGMCAPSHTVRPAIGLGRRLLVSIY